jgi:hypothetical protein
MARGQARPEGSGPGPGRHRPQLRHPEDVASVQRQPKPLQRAIPALTGGVLVVNATWANSSAAQLTGGLLGRLQLGRAAPDKADTTGVVSAAP